MKRKMEEAEVIARLDFLTNTTNICVVSWPAMARRMERLYGKPNGTSGDQIWRWTVKGLNVSFRKLRTGGILSTGARKNRGFLPSSAIKSVRTQNNEGARETAPEAA